MCYFCFLALLSQVGVFMFVFGFLFFVLPEERYFFLFLWHSPKLIRSWVKCWKPLNFHFCCVSSLFSKPVMVWAQIIGFWERPPPSPFPCSTIGPWGHAAHLPFWKVFQKEALPTRCTSPSDWGPSVALGPVKERTTQHLLYGVSSRTRHDISHSVDCFFNSQCCDTSPCSLT